jgi:hypothetical protein
MTGVGVGRCYCCGFGGVGCWVTMEANDLALPPFWMLIQPFGDGARGGRDDRDWLLPTPASPVLSEEGSVSAPEGGGNR